TSKALRPKPADLERLPTLQELTAASCPEDVQELAKELGIDFKLELKLETERARFWLCTRGATECRTGTPEGWVVGHVTPQFLQNAGGVPGKPPLAATIYRLQKLRCHLCGQVFTAPAPAGADNGKYDATAGSMIGLLKYGSGLPFNRLEGL